MNWQTFRWRALWCWHQLLTLALILLVLVAVLVGVGRQLLPMAGEYQGRVEAELSQRIGLPVRLEGFTADWESMGLNFRLLGLQLRDPVAPASTLLRIPEVEVHPALWQSLRHLEPRLEVRLRGLDIHLEQMDDGRVRLRELASLASHDPQAAANALRFALRQPALALAESRVGLSLQKFPDVTLSGIELVNRNDGDSHRLAGSFLSPGSREPLQLNLELNGDPLDWQQAQLSVWLHLPVLKLDGWLPAADIAGVRLLSVTGGGDYWFHFRQGRLLSAQTRLDWRELEVEGRHGRHQLQGMTGLLSWRRDLQPTGSESDSLSSWQLAGSQLKGRVNESTWPAPALAVRGDDRHLAVAVARADVAGMSYLMRNMPVPANVSVWLQEAAPQGQLTALRLDMVRDPPVAAAAPDGQAVAGADVRAGEPAEGDWRVRQADADIRTLSARSTGKWPGAGNLAGWLRWTPDTAWLALDGQDGELDLPQHLREKVPLSRFSGRFRLTRGDTGWQLDSDRVQAANADARGSAVFRLRVPQDDPQAATLSLLAGIERARAASTWRYVPWTAAGDEALDWLHRSILGGTVSQGHLLYDGPVHTRADLPDHRLLMHFVVKGGRLAYHPGWPELRDIDADVEIDGHRLAVTGNQARLLQATQARVISAVIEDLHHPVLAVSAEVGSTGPDLMTLFRDSELKPHTAGLAEVMSLDGALGGHLDLSVPLHSGQEAPGVAVRARLDGNRLAFTQAGLTASDLQGEVTYSTARGLQAPQLSATLLEAPVTASISSQVRRGGLQSVGVTVAGRAEVPALRRWLGSNLLQLASGGSAYQAQVTVPVAGPAAPVRLQLNSMLEGLRLDMPAPLGKSAGEGVPLRYQTTLGSGEQMARLQYGQRLSGGLVWEGSRLDRALFSLEGTAAAWPQHAGLEVEGKLARLDLREWKPWIDRLGSLSPGTVAAKGAAPLPSLTRLEIEARELLADGLRLQNARIALGRDGPAAWRVLLRSDELEGAARLPDAAGSEIGITFSRLQWPLPVPPGKAAADSNPVAGLGNRPVNLKGEGLRLAAWPGLGSIGLSARLLPSPYGLRIEDINLDSGVLDFNGRMDWQWRGGMRTRLRGNAGSRNVAGLLTAMGYAPSLVSPEASADIDLSWPGGPDKVQLSALDGQLSLNVKEGRLLTVSNVTSASRVFGWFDVDNLKRRFKGDFSDVLRRGLSFDKASLSGNLQAGVMDKAVFSVDGPTLKAEGSGRLDIGRQQMDQQFTVMVPVTSAVPVAAVVVAGPLVGGAIAAAQFALGKQIDKVTQLRYHVSGNWANPAVERMNMKVFDTRPAEGVQPVSGTP